MKELLLSQPMLARDPEEEHRGATSLELLFDLVSVIAIAAAATGLHHSIAEAHYVQGLISFFAAFFMVWWAWMNFTWFASAYDNDDTVFRCLTMLSMAGSLTIAAGISTFVNSQDMILILIGFVIMRLAMIAFWLRAALHASACRKTALCYAAGIAIAQLYWIVMILNQPGSAYVFYPLFGIGMLLELSVPYVAERQGMTRWHRHHIIERYGLFTIIVLGETLLATTNAVQQAAGGNFSIVLIHIAISALIVVFSLWWLYFSREDHLHEQSRSAAFTWGYGHFFIYMSGAAVGAGFAVLVDTVTGHAHLPLLIGNYAVAVPVAVFLFGLWLVRDRYAQNTSRRHVLPIFSVLILIAPPFLGLDGVTALIVISVFLRSRLVSLDEDEQQTKSAA